MAAGFREGFVAADGFHIRHMERSGARSPAWRRPVSSNSRCSRLRKVKKLCKTAGVMAFAIDHLGPSAMEAHPPPNI